MECDRSGSKKVIGEASAVESGMPWSFTKPRLTCEMVDLRGDNPQDLAVARQRQGGDPRPRGLFAPWSGRREIRDDAERRGELSREVSLEAVEADDARIGFGEVDGGESCGKEERQAPRAGERGGARGEDGAVIEERDVGGGEEQGQVGVGDPFEVQGDIGQPFREAADRLAVVRRLRFADDDEERLRARVPPMGEHFFLSLIGSTGAKHETDRSRPAVRGERVLRPAEQAAA